MAKVLVALTTSLDGYIAGPNDSNELPLGERAEIGPEASGVLAA
jgi:hypothetical protein